MDDATLVPRVCEDSSLLERLSGLESRKQAVEDALLAMDEEDDF